MHVTRYFKIHTFQREAIHVIHTLEYHAATIRVGNPVGLHRTHVRDVPYNVLIAVHVLPFGYL